MKPSEKIEACNKLRADLKANGLERTVQLMDVAQRGDARRLIREALECYVIQLDLL